MTTTTGFADSIDAAINLPLELVEHLGLSDDPRITAHKVAQDRRRLDWAAVLAEGWSSTEAKVLRIAASIYSDQHGAKASDFASLTAPHFEAVLSIILRARAAGVSQWEPV